jgi:hypothetical protein
LEVKWPFFFRSRSFAAERDEPEPVLGLALAIYAAVSVSSDPRSKGHF